MEHCLAAERALVAALVLGDADPAELSGRVRTNDFIDPVAGLVFETILQASRSGTAHPGLDLPRLLRAKGALRGDGYPVRELLWWLPTVSAPAHPEPWATLVVAGALGRLVGQCGMRLLQASESIPADDLTAGAGRVLAFGLAQRAAVHAAERRWAGLPDRWRRTIPPVALELAVAVRVAEVAEPRVAEPPPAVERELLGALVAAPKLLETMRWLLAEDFIDPACAAVFTQITQLHRSGAPVDLVTVSAALGTTPPLPSLGRTPSTFAATAPEPAAAEVCRTLDPRAAFPGSAGWLARQVLSRAVIEHAAATGRALCELAEAPASRGGVGVPLFEQALCQLQLLAERGQRWHQARVPAHNATRRVGLTQSRADLALTRTDTLGPTAASAAHDVAARMSAPTAS